jgi:hypothetical protein
MGAAPAAAVLAAVSSLRLQLGACCTNRRRALDSTAEIAPAHILREAQASIVEDLLAIKCRQAALSGDF